jgi:DNA-binding response OmpR family regulator
MRKILIVDDDQDILNILTLLFDIEGFDVKGIDNGYVIEETIKSFAPDIILLDVMLGGLDGREICHKLKDSNETRHIPIIMISANTDMSKITYKECRPDSFIPKPFDIEHVLFKVNDILST